LGQLFFFFLPEEEQFSDREHADIGAAKTIRDRALEIVRGDSRVTWYYVPKRPQDITTLKKLS
jgi:hypothetical protein